MTSAWLIFLAAALRSCFHLKAGVSACSRNVTTVGERSNEFSFQIYRQLKADSNVFFSGYSLYSALTLLYLGSTGESKEELRKILLFSDRNTEQDLESFSDNRQKLSADKNGSRLSNANKGWIDTSYEFVSSYASSLQRYFGEDALDKASFSTKPRDAEAQINNWVSKETHGLITQLLPAGFVNKQTQFVITNAVFFQGSWQHKFDSENTAERPFEVSPGKTIQVPTMATVMKVNISRIDNFASMVELPYDNGNFAMLILVPIDRPIDDVLESVDARRLQELTDKMEPWKIKILLPKFKVRKEYQVKDCFLKMGLKSTFSPRVDLSAIVQGSDNVAITEVIHQAAVAVTEEGTQAGAGTAIITGRSSLPTFAVDKPFAFFIRHVGTGTILFFGKIKEPSFNQDI